MLAEGAVLSVPSVIGDVNEHLHAIHGELPDLIGEDGFITDKNSQPLISRIEDRARAAGAKIANLTRQFFRKAEEKLVWDVLPKGDQMNLIVVANRLAVGRKHNSPVGDLRCSRGCVQNCAHCSCHNIRILLACQ